jgi:3-isopropylmalate/(R)-2-methylmalate dehydratase small subunit
MEPFTVIEGIAAPLDRADVNTDAIIPMKWLVTATRTGLGKGLFGAWRYRPDGSENPDFVLNQPAYRAARILIAGQNFGCGSSREHAPWALLDFGIRCIIAPGYASIFYEHCLKNGILPVVLSVTDVREMTAWALDRGQEARLSVDLLRRTITDVDGRARTFELDNAHRAALLEGRDEIDDTMRHAAAIAAFQARDRTARPWIYRE